MTLRLIIRTVLATALSLLSLPALAGPGSGKTSGPYVGAEIGPVNHHFVVEEGVPPAQPTARNVSQWGVGGGVFAGYDHYVTDRIRIGGEAAFNFGGRTPATTSAAGQPLSITPRFGYSLTARAGYALSNAVIAYGGAGYGGHRYRRNLPAGTADFGDWNQSFILLGGVELKVSSRANLRLEFMHLDGTRNQFMLGIPIRF